MMGEKTLTSCQQQNSRLVATVEYTYIYDVYVAIPGKV